MNEQNLSPSSCICNCASVVFVRHLVVTPEWLQNISLNCFSVKQRQSSRHQLRSSQSNQLIVPLVKLSTYGPRSFPVVGPTICNSLPDNLLRDHELSIDNFRRQLKTFLCAQYWRRHSSALETLCLCALYIYYLHIYVTLSFQHVRLVDRLPFPYHINVVHHKNTLKLSQTSVWLKRLVVYRCCYTNTWLQGSYRP